MQAMHSPEKDSWIDSIKSKINNMTKHQVWTTSNHPPYLKPLSTTWVFKKKTNEDGKLNKFKARSALEVLVKKKGLTTTKSLPPLED
ncbi:hypothetical protein O181_008034 [Austropuccinia psidii MF-1]|uniref:PH domain-containing protein n=1 Tax=Austropuccinia psidii MF-1 TaxID=1389203 RepID=A0A9Q3BN47_9BASI|nr:hypothetical protein [Austropuccinia psidii MF-1]